MPFLINPFIYAGAPATTLTDGLLAYHKLDGNSDDSIGSLSGTDTSITYNAASGIIISGASFNGSTSYVGLNGKVITSMSSMTVSCWVKVIYGAANDSFASQYEALAAGKWFSFNTSATNGNIQWATDAGGDGGIGRQFVEVACPGGAWHHVVGVRDISTSELRVYVDYNSSTAVTTGVYAGVISLAGGGDYSFGKINSGGSYYQGDLDEVGIWDRVLTEAEILELYNSGAGNQYPF